MKSLYILTLGIAFCCFVMIWAINEEKKYETFKAPLYKIETVGAISGSQWQAFGFGGGNVNSSTHYYAKDYQLLADNSIQFHTIEGDFIRCTHYKISRFNATFKRKTKYNQVFLLDPDDQHFIKVCSAHK